MVTLGAYIIGHDPSLALVKEGHIISILEAERITGMRYGIGMPLVHSNQLSGIELEHAIQYWGKICLDYLRRDLGGELIDFVAWAGPQHQQDMQWQEKVVKAIIEWIIKKSPEYFINNFNVDESVRGFNHHMCHAAAGYFTSPFDDALIFSFDGRGNDGHTWFFKGSGTKIKPIREVNIRFGSIYSYARFIVNDDFGNSSAAPGKLMGLSSYGRINKTFYKDAYNLIKNSGQGKDYLNRLMTNKWPRWMRRWFARLLGRIEVFNGISDQRARDWLASFQKAWTNTVLETISQEISSATTHNLVMTGGSALNAITNYEIYKSLTSHIYIPPNPSDSGIAAGAALISYYNSSDAVWHPVSEEFSPYKGISVLDSDRLAEYEKRPDFQGKISLNQLAKQLSNQKIIGVVSGRSEVGPRALGNRSILCDPTSPEMKNRLNKQVKFREWYRPFAPIVRLEDMSEYFAEQINIPYMSMIVPVREEYQRRLPAITHVDGTARVQTVTLQQYPFLWNLLKIYKELTGIGVLLNTSFNIKGKAILSTLEEAFTVMDTTGLDAVYYDERYWSK